MEDLDPQRSKPEFAESAIEDLRWLGIRWQEGPDIGGPYAPYIQSARHGIYLDALHKLIDRKLVYRCHCSRKDLAQLTQAPHDDEPIYPGTCRPKLGTTTADAFETSDPTRTNWRFRVPDGEAIEFQDGCFGPQQFVAGKDFGDLLVWRKDGVPAYQLAVAVDDAAMAITEVVRGADLLKSTARQILVCRALGLPEPDWYHCPLIRDSQGNRLSKRDNALSLRSLSASGLTAEAVLDRLDSEW
jgi:glutamyl-tRNA synthetase